MFEAKNSDFVNSGEEHEPIDQIAYEGNSTTSNDGVPIQKQPARETSYEKREIVAEWRVPLRGKLHKIEFEHGTTSGRRVLWIDEKVVSNLKAYCLHPRSRSLSSNIFLNSRFNNNKKKQDHT